MAVTLTQQPTSPNAAYTALPYVISGSGTTNNPQYSYVMDIYESGSSTLISRQFTQPNPEGVGVFNPSKIFQGELQYNSLFTTSSASYIDLYKKFEVKFGEAYSTSISSSLSIYPNLTSHSIEVFSATVDPNSGSFNFPSASYTPTVDNAEDVSVLTKLPYEIFGSSAAGLSSYLPPVTNNDFYTINSLKTDNYYVYDSGFPAGPYYVALLFYEDITFDTWYIPTTAGATQSDTGILNFPIGPANLKQLSITSSLNNETFTQAFARPWSIMVVSYRGTVIGPSSVNAYLAFMPYYNPYASSDSLRYWGYDDRRDLIPTYNPCSEYVRFAFINSLGTWDYYSVFNPVKRVTNLERSTFVKPKVNYSSSTSLNNLEQRGNTQYNIEHTDNYEVTTDYITKTISDYVNELLESPSVFVQQGSDFVPVVITNSTYTANNSTARNKLFNYTITFRPAKGRELYF